MRRSGVQIPSAPPAFARFASYGSAGHHRAKAGFLFDNSLPADPVIDEGGEPVARGMVVPDGDRRDRGPHVDPHDAMYEEANPMRFARILQDVTFYGRAPQSTGVRGRLCAISHAPTSGNLL
jgi:hypothetical protein